MYSFDEIANFDPEIAQAMTDEINRQAVSYTHLTLPTTSRV